MTLGIKKILATDDTSLVFGTENGFDDLSGKSNITTTNAIVGKNIVLTNGSISWNSLTPTTFVYVYDPDDGTGLKHYASSNGTVYTNGVVGGSLPFSVGATGISGVTGRITKLKIFDEIKTADWIKFDYEKESKYW